MITTFNNYLISNTKLNNGIKSIRPKLLLEFIEKKYDKPVEFKLNIPSSGIGSLTMLEAMIMNVLIKIMSPQTIFEFGTFLGYSTHILASNSDKNTIIYSLDLGQTIENNQTFEKEVLSNDILNDDYLRTVQAKRGTYYLSSLDSEILSKIKLLHCDSRLLNPNLLGLKNKVDLFFIDGGHTYDIIENDTNLSLSMKSNPAIFIWHDYNSKIHRDVTNYLNNRSINSSIYHIENTMIAFEIIF